MAAPTKSPAEIRKARMAKAAKEKNGGSKDQPSESKAALSPAERRKQRASSTPKAEGGITAKVGKPRPIKKPSTPVSKKIKEEAAKDDAAPLPKKRVGPSSAEDKQANATPFKLEGKTIRIPRFNGPGMFKMMVCGKCNALVAWAQSKSGKWYLCEIVAVEVVDDENTAIAAVPQHPHFKYCGSRMSAFDPFEGDDKIVPAERPEAFVQKATTHKKAPAKKTQAKKAPAKKA